MTINLLRLLKSGFYKIADLILPPKCLSCTASVSNIYSFCPNCWNKLKFITEPMCLICGHPFSVKIEKQDICLHCLQEKPKFNQAKAAVKFDGLACDLIYHLKYHDKTEYAPILANLMAQAGKNLIDKAHIITAVPIHINKLRLRKYNQSLMLAKYIAKKFHKPLCPDLLIRTQNSMSQSGLTRDQRLANVHDAFAVNPKRQNLVKDKNILIIDDVITTGATINECAKIIKELHPASVMALSFAKTF